MVDAPTDTYRLSRNIRFVCEALAHYMFDLSESSIVFSCFVFYVQVFTNSLQLETSYLDHWKKEMMRLPRHTLFVSKDSMLLKELEDEMRANSKHVEVVDSEMDLKEEIKVFADNEGEKMMFIAKSPLFDVYSFLSVVFYLIAFYLAVMISHNVILWFELKNRAWRA
jgi:hypothetical protein